MKKATLYYIFIFAGIFLYTYYIFSSSSDKWDSFGYRYSYKNNLKVKGESIFCILTINNKPVKFFKIEGWTSSDELAVRFGKNIRKIPRSYYNAINKSKGKTTYWLRDLVNDDSQFDDKITIYSLADQDSLRNVYQIHTFSKTQYHKLISLMDPDAPLTFTVLTFLAYLIISFYRYLTSLKILKTTFQTKAFVFIIFIVAFLFIISPFVIAFEMGMHMVSGSHSFTTIPSLFFVFVLVFLIFQYFKNMIKTDDFAERQWIIMALLLTLSFSIEFLIKSFVNDVFTNNSQYTPMHSSSFWITSMSQRLWFIFIIAKFISNLTIYLYSLRRKSRLLKSTLDEAEKSLNTLHDARLEINHHFLFNSLHALAGITSVHPEKTEKFALSLATYYRYITNKENKHWATVEDEMAAVNAYMDVEKIRYSGKLVFDANISTYVDNEKLPRFILPPILEFAIKHGYNASKDLTEIKLTITKVGDTLSIKVFDTGQQYDQNILSDSELTQIRKILQELYGNMFTMNFSNDPKKQLEITLKTIQ
ncbi:MAG: histidine kinase [Saprospiraceae bacterium]|nr:histidine kinase [Saprospiraceae bacterium]